MLYVAQQVNSRAHLVAYEVARLFSRPLLPEHLLITLADAQARAAVVREIDDVTAKLVRFVHLVVKSFDVDFRRDENGFFRRIAPARIRVERAYELNFGEQRVNVNVYLLGKIL